MIDHHHSPDGGYTVLTRDLNGKVIAAHMPEETTRHKLAQARSAAKEGTTHVEEPQADDCVTVSATVGG